MSKKLIVLAHGIGDTKPDFFEEWKGVIAQKHNLNDVDVKGLRWEKALQAVADKYPVFRKEKPGVVAKFNFPIFKDQVGGSAGDIFEDSFMDILVYVGLKGMWEYIRDECILKLDALRKDENGNEIYKKEDTILIGHSLGAAMLPQLVWHEFAFNHTIQYRGMILLASPLGFESPLPQICDDFLRRMGEMVNINDRRNTIANFARAWDRGGNNRMRFICNENDIVCSNINLLPVRMGFDSTEIDILNNEHEESFESVSFGERVPSKIVENHDVLTYLKQNAFNRALNALLQGE